MLQKKFIFVINQQISVMQKESVIAQSVSTVNKELFVEGKAKIYTKYIEQNHKGQLVQNGVFYNPVQIFNRDCTLLVMQTFINMLRKQRGQKFDGVSIIDALSASGLRTIRFINELQGIKVVYANDISPASHKLMKDNFVLNNLDQSKIKMTLEDANLLLHNEKKNICFDIIDMDPYGSVVPFLDATVQNIKDGGLLCITCTDTKVTCGPDISKCFYYYGTTRAKVHSFQENSLRIVLNTISSASSRHCKYIEPLFGFQTDFYLRVFLRVRRGKKECAETALKLGNVYNCNSCGNYQWSPFFVEKTGKKQGHVVPGKITFPSNFCRVCKEPYYLNGPIWLGQLNNENFINQMMQLLNSENQKFQLQTKKKIYGTLQAILDQKQLAKIPLGFNFDRMCKNTKASTANKKFLYAGIESLGFKIAPCYLSPGVYKTNATFKVIYDIIKSWKLKEVGQQKYLTNVVQTFSIEILKSQIQFKPNFEHKFQSKLKHAPHFISMGKGMGPKGKPQQKIITQQHKEQQNKQQQQNKEQKDQQIQKGKNYE